MTNKSLQKQLDAELSRIEWTQHDRYAVLNRMKEGSVQPVMVKKMSRSLALTLVLAILTTGALAAGLIFSQKADAGITADRALESSYGITTEMLTYFTRDVVRQPDGSYVATYTGVPELNHVLGTYTVRVNGKDAKAEWTHDGADTSCGLESFAWGAAQLAEVLAIRKVHVNDVDTSIKNAAYFAGQPEPLPIATPAVDPAVAADAFYAEQQALAKQSKLPMAEMQELARMALCERYQLTDAQAAMLEYNPDLSWYRMDNDVLYYDFCFMLTQGTSPDDDSLPEYTEMDGQYTVLINTETGVIENVDYESALAGNG